MSTTTAATVYVYTYWRDVECQLCHQPTAKASYRAPKFKLALCQDCLDLFVPTTVVVCEHDPLAWEMYG
jgi:hypothetical protein